MDEFVIRGGNKLEGEISVSGAKNSALPIICSCLLNGAVNTLTNVPDLRDISTVLKLLEVFGCKTEQKKNTVTIDSRNISSMVAPYDLVRTMRASVLVLGPLLARFGFVSLSLPGGCAIGARPINLHLQGLEKMGAEIALKAGYVEVKARKLIGTRIYLDIPTVTGTENLMMAAVLAEGVTTIENAAQEPEISDLAKALIKMGAKIKGAGTDTIIIQGVQSLNGMKHRIVPDRIEAGTFIIAAIISRGDLIIKNAQPAHLSALLVKLRASGATIDCEDSTIRVQCRKRTRAVDIKTMPYPGFPTDMQAQMTALMSISDGLCVIKEKIFENRFMHVSELNRMGAKIRIEGPHAIVTGVDHLSGAPVMATDLRASACLVLAGLVAQGETRILRVYHIDRGYEKIEEKLGKVGADIVRISK